MSDISEELDKLGITYGHVEPSAEIVKRARELEAEGLTPAVALDRAMLELKYSEALMPPTNVVPLPRKSDSVHKEEPKP